jgi:DNA-binding IclR family transcriptional regulator
VQTAKEGGGRVHLTPGDLAARLGVSGSTFRRISTDYEAVFEALPRDAQRRRLWPLEAAERVVLAHEAVREGQADSTRSALELVRAGRELVTPLDPPALGAEGGRVKLDELSAQIRQQGEGITTLLQALDERDSEIAGALRALGEAQQAQAEALRELREEVRARPAPAPPSASPSGWWERVLKRVLGSR